MEWKEVNPEQPYWKRQIDVMAYYGDYKIASIILCDGEWSSVNQRLLTAVLLQ